MATVFLILVTPEIMDAIALATWFPRIKAIPLVGIIFTNGWGPFNGGINKLWVGQSLYASAVVTLIVRARLSGIDESLSKKLQPISVRHRAVLFVRLHCL